MRVEPEFAKQPITQVSSERLSEALTTAGAALFRGFHVDQDAFESLSGRLSRRFTSYVFGGRRVVSREAKIQTVNLGFFAVPPHGELTDSPTQPHVCWFYCVRAPRQGGETLVSDSARIATDMDPRLLEKFRHRLLRYRIPLGPEFWRPMFDVTDLTSLKQRLEVWQLRSHFSLEGETLIQDYRVPLFSRSRFSGKLACVNALVHDSIMSHPWHHQLCRFYRRLGVPPRFLPLLAPLPWAGAALLSYPTFEDGESVPRSLIQALAAITDSNQYVHRWEQGDVLVLDNTRMLHGRRRLMGPDRKIFTRFGHVEEDWLKNLN